MQKDKVKHIVVCWGEGGGVAGWIVVDIFWDYIDLPKAKSNVSRCIKIVKF